MKTTLRSLTAGTALAMVLVSAPSFAKGPIETPSQIILAKENVTVIEAADFPWNLEEGRTKNVRFEFEEISLVAPSMDVEKDGDDKVTISFPEITSEFEEGSKDDGSELSGTGVVLQFERDGEKSFAASTQADAIKILVLEKAVKDADGPVEIEMNDLEMSFFADGTEPLYADGKTPFDYDGDEIVTFLPDMTVSYEASLGGMTMIGSPEPGKRFTATAGQSNQRLAIEDGQFDMVVKSEDVAVDVNADFPFKMSFGKMDYRLAMPIDVSPDPQSVQISFDARDLEVNELIWAMFDPKDLFDHEMKALNFDVEVEGIVKASPFDKKSREEFEDRTDEAFVPTRMTLNALEIDAVGLEVSGEGFVEVENDVPTDLSAFLSVAGLSEVMKSAVEAGFLKGPQAIMAEGMANQLGKEQPDGSLTFDVGIKNGMVTINDSPIAPLPQ